MPTSSFITVMTSNHAPTLEALLWPEAEGPSPIPEMRQAGAAFLVASRDGEPAGAIAYRWEGMNLRVLRLRVAPAHRHAGVARRMLQAIEAIGASLGTRLVRLQAPPASAGICQQVGYQPEPGAGFVKVLSP